MPTLPYVSSPGNIAKALNGIKSASVPDKVSQDFVKTVLKIPGGSGDQMTAFLKKLGLAAIDGTPTEQYRKFRNPASSGTAIAAAIKAAYAPLYVRNEYMHELSDADLLGLIVEETGDAHDSNSVKLTHSSIKHLKNFAIFNGKIEHEVTLNGSDRPKADGPWSAGHASHISEKIDTQPNKRIGLNLGYTINLNLPATSDPAVFDAIFKSLRDNLLREEDG